MGEILVIGGGSWGTAFADYLCSCGASCSIWIREPEVREALISSKENPVFLPGVTLHPELRPVADLPSAVREADILLNAVPSKFIRSVFTEIKASIRPEQILVNLSKGFEADTMMTISEIAAQVWGGSVHERWVTLSGPSFARELAQKHPTAMVAAATCADVAEKIQHDFSSRILRIYRTEDLRGVEIGGSLKNVMAIASGMIRGLGFGVNTTATLVTRASVEIGRLGLRMGGRLETFWGLAGIGDLMLTCFGELSRNFQLGKRIAGGETLHQIESSTPMIAEGVETTRAVRELAEKLGVDMPISFEVFNVLFQGKTALNAIGNLMSRSLKTE